jgi:hypothetical protein
VAWILWGTDSASFLYVHINRTARRKRRHRYALRSDGTQQSAAEQQVAPFGEDLDAIEWEFEHSTDTASLVRHAAWGMILLCFRLVPWS